MGLTRRSSSSEICESLYHSSFSHSVANLYLRKRDQDDHNQYPAT